MKPRKPTAAAEKKAAQEAKHHAAIPDVESAIEKHGYDSVRWVVNRLNEKYRLQKEFDRTRAEYEQKLSAIKSKMDAKIPEATTNA